MSDVLVTGIGCVMPGAAGRAEFVRALEEGESRLVPDPEGRDLNVALVETADPEKRVPIGKRRRMNRVGLFATAAALDALADAGLGKADLDPERTGIVVGTGLGCSASVGELYREVLRLGPADANPAIFPTGVPNAIASQVALVLALGGPNVTVSQREVSGEAALALGAEWIRDARADRVLVGGVDELTDHLADYLTGLGVAAPSGAAVRPFAEVSAGAGVGEGAMFLVLEGDGASGRAMARIRGWSIRATPVGTSCLDGSGDSLAEAISACVFEPPSLVVAGANGHRPTDLAHLVGIDRGLSGADVPALAIKEQFGESLSRGVAAAAAASLRVEEGSILVAGTAHGGTSVALVLDAP
jgi:act minimal PKS ketosynthase (KS/KS alpha)